MFRHNVTVTMYSRWSLNAFKIFSHVITGCNRIYKSAAWLLLFWASSQKMIVFKFPPELSLKHWKCKPALVWGERQDIGAEHMERRLHEDSPCNVMYSIGEPPAPIKSAGYRGSRRQSLKHHLLLRRANTNLSLIHIWRCRRRLRCRSRWSPYH